MLVRLTVENFKSFSERAELSLVSSSKVNDMPSHVEQFAGVSVLKHAAIYGANASGKSNLIECVRFVQQTLLRGLTLESTKWYCRSSQKNERRESTFELQFSVGDEFYAYGFSAVLSERRVLEEWLYLLEESSSIPLFERVVETERITSGLLLEEAERARFETYAQDFTQSPSLLFLAELNRSKRYSKHSPFSVFKRTFDWLLEQIQVIGPTEHMIHGGYSGYFLDEDNKGDVESILASFDTGILGIELRELSNEELVGKVPPPVIERMRDDLEERFGTSDAKRIAVTVRSDESLLFVECSRNGDARALAVELKHAGSPWSLFDFSEESDGTRRLFDLICVLLIPRDDIVFVIDELERSLHPMLVRQLITMFTRISGKARAQLLFSTHEASIMSQKLFRRDETWFVDRGRAGNSRLYSLDRFKERFDEDVSKAYLEGRYGAVPVFSEYVLGKRRDRDAFDS